MSGEKKQFYIDRIKNTFYSKIAGLEKKVKSNMHSVLIQLEAKNLLPEKIIAIEMFGMHGLWHTLDYINYVESLDIFEINKKYHELSKISLKNYPVNFYQLDSINYIKETEKKYNFIVSDIPFGGDFYLEDGLPYFFDDLIRISEKESIIIFNCHTDKLKEFNSLINLIKNRVGTREIKDLFFVPRNKLISYIVLSLK